MTRPPTKAEELKRIDAIMSAILAEWPLGDAEAIKALVNSAFERGYVVGERDAYKEARHGL